MLARTLATACALALMAGCAGPSPAPELSADHPAHPDAAAAPLPPRSTTLAVDAGGAAQAPATAPAAHKDAPVDGPVVYACPHHPEVTSDKPGQRCPKCGMLLVKRETAPAAGNPHEGHR
jgi:hypothetical protein